MVTELIRQSWRAGDPLRLPARIDRDVIGIVTAYFAETQNTPRCLNWLDVRWVNLVDGVIVLQASSKAADSGRITWAFVTQDAASESSDEEFKARIELGEVHFSGILSKLRALDHQLTSGELYPKQLDQAVKQMRLATAKYQYAREWIEKRVVRFQRARLLGFLHRFDFLNKAREAGVEIDDTVFSLPFVRFARVHDSAAHSLASVAALADLDKLVDDLSDETYLTDIFASDANSRLISGGALARILARELGANVAEHARARRAWFCSRVAVVGTGKKQRRFLEVIVADDGAGVTADLIAIVAKDPRPRIHGRWHQLKETDDIEQFLLDYAFDRFTSSKRSLNDLMHLPRKHRGIVSSGLFWIWNLVAAEGGILDVRTATASATYDFRRNRTWKHRRRVGTRASAGTLVRVILPLSKAETSKPLAANTVPLDLTNFAYTWAGDLAESEGFPPSDRAAQATLKIAELAFRESLFARLRERHGNADDGTLLVIDLSGIRPLWEKASAVPLAHFFIESNYTSVFGRSAVVLWNVPETSAVLFEQAVEFAARQFAHLDQIRRVAVMVFDSGRVRIIANSAAVERSLAKLSSEGELELEQLVEGLNVSDDAAIRRAIRENSHLFNISADDVVHFRAWPTALTAAVWTQGVEWLFAKIDAAPPNGICFQYESAVFRLPSLGEYARRFFHFRALLADREAEPRLAWLVAHAVRAAEMAQAGTAELLVSVTRPSSELAREVASAYAARFKRTLRVITAETPEELALYEGTLLAEHAIYITTVMSTGSTSERVARSTASWIHNWLGTIACVDTRQTAEILAKVQVAPGAWLSVFPECATGEVYALGHRDVGRIRASNLRGERIVAIDPLNVCPVTPPNESTPNSFRASEDDLWRYARESTSVIHVGHFEEADGHHYAYLADTAVLLHSALQESAETVMDGMVRRVLTSIGDVDPNKIILLHPPSDVSMGERIAREVQRRSGAKYRDVLYRDTFAGRARFSPLAELSLPWRGATVVLLDDATNTGEALMGLVDTATRNRPLRVIAWIALSRLPVHRGSLFSGITALERCRDVQIHFALSLDIPVFTEKTCPICQLRQRLQRARAAAPLLRGAIERVRRALASRRLLATGGEFDESYLFAALNPTRVARLREAIERSDFDGAALQLWERTVREAMSRWQSICDLAFILCSEPELVNAAALTAYLLPLLSACEDAVQECTSRTVVSVMGFAVVLSTRLTEIIGETKVSELIGRVSIALLARSDITAAQLGSIASLLLAFTKFDNDSAIVGRRTASMWSMAFDRASAGQAQRLPPISRLYLSALRAGTGVYDLAEGSGDFGTATESSALCERAEEVASTFWSHATETLKNWIDQMEVGAIGEAEFLQPLFALAEAMTELQGLQQLFVSIDDLAVRRHKLQTGISRTWRNPAVALAIDGLLDPVATILDALDRGRDGEIQAAIVQLQQRWSLVRDTLDPAFNELFPEVVAVAARAWQRFEKQANLPLTVASKPSWGEVDRAERAFVPEPVLWRFLAAALENLGTAAFHGLSDSDMSRAKATLALRKETDEYGRVQIFVRISDNGPAFRRGALETSAAPGHGEALSAVRTMIGWFDGELIGPKLDAASGQSFVELSMRKYK